MQRKSLILTLTLTASAAAAVAVQDTPGFDRDDAAKAEIFEKLTAGGGDGGHSPCGRMAFAARKASRRTATADLYAGLTVAVNVGDPVDQWDAVLDAFAEYEEAIELTEEQFHLRLELCANLGQDGTYEPEIDPDNFSSDITNPLLGWTIGDTWVYEKTDKDGYELIHVTPLDDTREIMGVECRAVIDTVWKDPVDDDVDGLVIVEETIDYYAQDLEGNVWYFGEISINYEDGHIANLDGTWFAGTDNAHAGIVMLAAPQVGQTYRQEFLAFEAEDAATVLDVNATAEIKYGTFHGCLVTFDYTPLDPEALEHKYFAPGVGLVLEVDVETGDRLELIDIVPGD